MWKYVSLWDQIAWVPIKPKEVIPGRDSDLYAIHTLLGWGVIGPISETSKEESSDALCYRVAVWEIGNKEPIVHKLCREQSMTDK